MIVCLLCTLGFAAGTVWDETISHALYRGNDFFGTLVSTVGTYPFFGGCTFFAGAFIGGITCLIAGRIVAAANRITIRF